MTLNIRSWITGVNTLKTSRLWIGLLIIVTLFSSFALVIMGREWLDIQPMNHSVHVPSKLLGSYSGVTIKTREGWKLACSMAPSRNGGTVILLHGYAADRLQLLPEASLLQQEGFGILFCDSRAQGESEGRLITYGQEEALDLHEIVTWLSRQEAVDSQKIAGFGFSMGA
ncbi:MAG: hypothetical protein NTX25_22680, partial [Proteobacteria bacterium]|nr:hypothetical protein [Pseudomonadota bacterium]